jgi:excisionase family DNA binding protein
MSTPNKRRRKIVDASGDSRWPEPMTVTVQMAERLSSLSHTTIYELIKQGRLRTTKAGARTLIDFKSRKAVLRPVEASG